MRSIKELLQVMLAHPKSFSTGMCNWAVELYWSRYITSEESNLLKKYIKDNRPSNFSSWNAFCNTFDAYYWDRGDITPRVKWIEKQINNLK